jgi:hypothetical protein
VWDEYVSVGAARDEYGVVITGSVEAMDLTLDRDATDQLRAERRVSERPRAGYPGSQ